MSTARGLPPTLFGAGDPLRAASTMPASERPCNGLLELMHEGCTMVILLRNGQVPTDAAVFRERLSQFLADFERGAQRLGVDAESAFLARFAFCALVDELVLTAGLPFRAEWERRPLQLELFGEQLAGERFFEHLDLMRQGGAPRVQVLEVFHMCLLLGFQGRYLLEGTERLGYLSARLGEEIAHLRGRRAGFAPHAEPPDQVVHRLRTEVPLWVVASVFALVAVLGFIGMKALLQRQTAADLAGYRQLVTLPPQAAHVTITLP